MTYANSSKDQTGIVLDLERRINGQNADILRAVARLRSDLDRVQRHITEGLRLNERGEVGDVAAGLDRLIALRQQSYDTLNWLTDYVEATPYAVGDELECLGHETTSGPIGSVSYCDGTCR